MIGHLPPLKSWRCCCRKLKVLWCREFLNFPVCLQPPRMCVLVSGERHLVHWSGPVLPSFLHLYTWTPQATSSESRLALCDDVEYAWMVWSEPASLAWCKMRP